MNPVAITHHSSPVTAKTIKRICLILVVAVLGIQILQPAVAADHRQAPMLALDAVVFEGSRPVVDADGNLMAVSRVHFSAVTADGHEIEGSGELLLSGQNQDDGDAVMTGSIEDILGRFRDITDGLSNTFTGRAQVGFDSISVDDRHFEATGDMRLHAGLLEPALVREFEIVADAVQGNDGRWSARFSGEDRLGLGVRIDGFYVSSNEWGFWDDADVVQLQGDVEALGLLDSGYNSTGFEDKLGAEEMYFVYDGPGRLDAILPSSEVEGRFSARLTLPVIGSDASSRDDLLNIGIGDVIVSESARTADGQVSGRADVFFSGVGSRDGVEVTVNGTAEFRFYGDVLEGSDWYMPTGEFRILNATLADTETGGALLFEDVSSRLGQARIVATIDPSGQVDLAGGLGQVTQIDLDRNY